MDLRISSKHDVLLTRSVFIVVKKKTSTPILPRVGIKILTEEAGLLLLF